MKKIIWLGSSHGDLLAFPEDARKIAGYNLDKVQRGEDPTDWKPMPSVGRGVKEIRIHCANEYRVIYLAQRDEGVYVLHSFVKKTQETSIRDLELAKKRFSQIK
ncbi:type II toxin-antitoxin system RelE/ParE family toxin (plasmid) [Legionella geestiana]|uniref:type II toxin-antitoxin system RelE/ParE family toxin n=1 Tax=Legionella geestiana TaxID=45065 RepID=UPI001091AF5E|nr:type II toxin-antitoxin system RelE/ParE family toxin [Legionella geestiana]QDQ41181.1 type II toxin-antitoxin system RelE/ParE family toxin [Legionella geestiana]